MVSEPMVSELQEENGVRMNSHTIAMVGQSLIRYGLVLVIGWIGAMKFTGYEAQAIQPMVANSPLLGWVYQLFSIQTFSNLLGVVEVAIAVMIGLRPLAAKVAAIGSALAVVMFLTTLTFLFTTPGWEPSLGGFPGLSVVPGQFLVKDVVLLGGALWLLAEALNPAVGRETAASSLCRQLFHAVRSPLRRADH